MSRLALPLALLWWAPSLALALLDVATFYARQKLALWLVALLMDLGVVGLAGRLLDRSRRGVERYGRARGVEMTSNPVRIPAGG